VAQHLDRVDHRTEVIVFRRRHAEILHALRLGLEPEDHLRNDAEVCLREQARHVGTEPVLVQRPQLGVAHGTGAGTDHLAIRQHRFDAADPREVVTEETDAMIERVADRSTRAVLGSGNQQRNAPLAQVVAQLDEADAGLQHRVAIGDVDLDDAIHPLEIDDDRPRQRGRGAAVAEIAAGGGREEWNAILVSDPHHPLHLLDGDRGDGSARDDLLVRHAAIGRVRIAIQREVVFACEDLFHT
jgi:hypothetical protein